MPVIVTGELSETYVAAGSQISVTFRFSEDVSPFLNPFQYFSYTDGIVPLGVFSFNDRHYGQTFRVPTTGVGEGSVSFLEDVLPGGNNAVTLRFTYVDEINAEISLSAASAENGGVILAQFDFDFPVPAFSASAVEVNLNKVLAANRKVLAANGTVLALNIDDAVVGPALAIDDAFKCWQVPITVPGSGEGEVEVSLPEDAIGFYQSAVQAPVFYAPVINLNINLADNLKLLPVINQDFKHDIDVTGNNVETVNVEGLLRPFSHNWDSTTGKLSIVGRPEKLYQDLEFEVNATDADGAADPKSAVITVIEPAPVVKENQRLVMYTGAKYSGVIEVANFPKEVEVIGTWIGLNHKIVEEGIEIFGDIPNAVFGVNAGSFFVKASNSGGETERVLVSWRIADALVPVIAAIGNRNVDSDYVEFTIQATLSSGTPGVWSITGEGATISDTGLITISAGIASGTHKYTVGYTNTAGGDTEDFSLVVAEAVVAPVIAGISNVSRTVGYFSFTIQASLLSGTPGTWSISGTGSSISSSGLIIISSGRSIGTHTYTVSHTNAAGSDSETFSLTVSAIPPVISGIRESTWDFGTDITATISVISGTTPVTWSVSGLIPGQTWTATGSSITISGPVNRVGRNVTTVTASNSAGSASTSYVVNVRQRITAPGAVTLSGSLQRTTSLTHWQVNLSWTAPTTGSPPTSYEYWGTNFPDGWVNNGLSRSRSFSQAVNTSVTYFVRARNSAGAGALSNGVLLVAGSLGSVPPVVSRFFSVGTPRTAVQIRWGTVSANPPVTNYQVWYKLLLADANDWISVETGNTFFVILRGLQRRSTYVLLIRAQNAIGYGDFSSVLRVETS